MRDCNIRRTFPLNYDRRKPTIEPPMWSTLPPPFTHGFPTPTALYQHGTNDHRHCKIISVRTHT